MQASQQQVVTYLTNLQRLATLERGAITYFGAGSATGKHTESRKPSLKTVSPIHRSALGGYTIEGPFNRRPSRIAHALERFFYWLGA
ncbi:hypothetical protein [Paraburkholderia oxyphila]|uniref:hypothetical protein n=1 Tax=Paraburkholderia oxyphila TaxID=614212 RepID=UPI0005BB53D2|nr:hypothetical protein [Paraburkholderia oxyphila]